MIVGGYQMFINGSQWLVILFWLPMVITSSTAQGGGGSSKIGNL